VSRLWPVWVVTGLSSAAQSHWSLYLMVGSWSLVEVPRYVFYAVNLVTEKVRYSFNKIDISPSFVTLPYFLMS